MPLVLLGLAGIFNKMAGQILIPIVYPDRVAGMTALGVYAGNLKIAVVMVMFMQAFRFAYDPFVFAKMKAKDSHDAYRVAMNYFTLFGLFIFLGVMYWIDLFKYIVEPEYYVGLVVVPIAMLGEILFGIYYNLSIWYKVSDRTYYGAIFSLVGLILTVGIILWGVPLWGPVAAAWASLICNLAMLILSYAFGQKIYPIRYNIFRLLVAFIITFFFYWVGGLITPDALALRLLLRTLLLLIIYLPILAWLLAPELIALCRQYLNPIPRYPQR